MIDALATRIACLALGLALAAAWPGPAAALEQEPLPGGSLEALVDGQRRPFPLLKTDARVELRGDLASVQLTQHFANPYDFGLHARYVFPLPPNAAVHAMRLVSGDRVIEARIQRKQEARAQYEAAKARGNQAALLTQHRPNVFTQEVANLMPGLPVRVEIEYAHVVPKRDGHYDFHLPMVVGPRYLAGPGGAPTAQPGEPEPLEIGEWNLPDSPPVSRPEEIDPERVGLAIRLEAGLPIQWVDSPTHPVDVKVVDEQTREIALAEGRTLDNTDFVLRYRLEGEKVAAGVTTHGDNAEGFVSLLLEPPAKVESDTITAREMVFVLDCSGSMSGVPLAASKRFMREAMAKLRPGDHFRVIRFSDSATAFSETPLPATPANVSRGLAYVEQLHGSGGTQMASGIRAALAPPIPAGALRIVVFLTDGYIGNDVEIVRLIEATRGDARLFSFGIGNAVNRYLIQEMARVGRGVARIVKPDDDAEDEAQKLAERLQTPVLTDLEVDWGSAPVSEPTPSPLPDLFAGESVRVLARYHGAGSHRVTVRGRVAGRPVSLPLTIELPVRTRGDAAALPLVWARSQIEDRMVSYLAPTSDFPDRRALEEEITDLGLRYRLVTKWTSFVAVAKDVVNPGEKAREADVAVPQVKDVSKKAYSLRALGYVSGGSSTPQPVRAQPTLVAVNPGPAGANSFTGNAAPEPAVWLGASVLAALGWLTLRRRRGA